MIFEPQRQNKKFHCAANFYFFCEMSDDAERNIYAKVAENITNNIESINDLLENCEINSEVAKQEKQILDFLSLDGRSLIYDEAKDDYYNLEKVSKVFEMLRPARSENKKKLKFPRSESVTSLSSTHSCDDVSILQRQDSSVDVQTCLLEIRKVAENIKNIRIEYPNLDEIQNQETKKNEKFNGLFIKLQKISKELENIASTETTAQNQDMPKVGEELVENLKRLNQVSFVEFTGLDHDPQCINFQMMSDFKLCSTNPMAEMQKQDSCSFLLTGVVNSVLEAIEKNPL